MLQSNQRILLVDDDELICKTYAKALNQTGFNCATAGSAEAAIEVLKQEEFALILLDIGHPARLVRPSYRSLPGDIRIWP